MSKFNYIVARIWPGTEDELCVYSSFREVHYGSIDEANQLLERIKRTCLPSVAEKLRIIKINIPSEMKNIS